MTGFGPIISEAQVLRGYGVKLAGIIASQDWEYSSSTFTSVPSSSLWGMGAGTFAELFNLPYVSLVIELDYLQRGRTVTIDQTAKADNEQGYVDLGPGDIDERFHYAAVTIMPKFRLDYETFAPFVAFGPSFQLLIGHPATPVAGQFSKTEFAVSISAGAEITFAALPRLMAEVRYTPTITKSYQNQLVSVHDNAFEFFVGVSF